MKKIVAFAAVFVLLLSFFAPIFSRAYAAGESDAAEEIRASAAGYNWGRFKDAGISLNVYNWGEYISTGVDGESLNANAAFEELTGIKINYTTFDNNEAMRAKLMSGGASYDVIIPSDYMIGLLAKQDMLASLNFENIPNYAHIGKDYKDQAYDPQNAYSVPYMWGYVGIIYNTTMVQKPVNSWDILWDEEYKNNILMFDNSRDAFAIAFKKLGMPINPTSTEDINKAAQELMAQKNVVQAFVMDQIFDKMAGGEAALAPYYAGDAITMIEENPQLAFAVPKEGTNYFIDAACIPKTSANKEAAEMYINFLCEPTVAVENSMAIGYSTPNTAAWQLLPDEVKNNPIAYPDPQVMANTETFNVLPDELNAAMDKAWSDMRGGSASGNGWVIPLALLVAVVLIVLMFLRARKKKKRTY